MDLCEYPVVFYTVYSVLILASFTSNKFDIYVGQPAPAPAESSRAVAVNIEKHQGYILHMIFLGAL